VAHLFLYDGVCGLCNAGVRFLLRRRRAERFQFAPLQGALAAAALRRHGCDPTRLDAVVVVADAGTERERLLRGPRAVLFALSQLGGAWRLVRLLAPLPDPLLETAYRFVAYNRYRWFGRSDACAPPDPPRRSRFSAGGPVTPPGAP
jgi:predicted DCC family thiol-disulfide oxidoreductase YuxK